MFPCFIKPFGHPWHTHSCCPSHLFLEFPAEAGLALRQGSFPCSAGTLQSMARVQDITSCAKPMARSTQRVAHISSLTPALPNCACFSRPWGVASFLSLSIFFFLIIEMQSEQGRREMGKGELSARGLAEWGWWPDFKHTGGILWPL